MLPVFPTGSIFNPQNCMIPIISKEKKILKIFIFCALWKICFILPHFKIQIESLFVSTPGRVNMYENILI